MTQPAPPNQPQPPVGWQPAPGAQPYPQYQPAPAGYPQQQQYPYPYPAAPTPTNNSRGGFAVTSLVLGIIGTLFGFIPLTFFMAWILGAVGLIFGLLAWRRGLGKAGTILSVIAIAMGIVGVIIVATAVKHLNDDLGGQSGPDGSGYRATLDTAKNDSIETSVPVTIQNTSGKTCDFWVTVTANSPDGATQLASGSAIVNDVAPHQTASDEAGLLKLVPAGTVFKVGTVSKTCR